MSPCACNCCSGECNSCACSSCRLSHSTKHPLCRVILCPCKGTSTSHSHIELTIITPFPATQCGSPQRHCQQFWGDMDTCYGMAGMGGRLI
ncbi:hypothetical protein BJX70DRAFT_88687 [Aspergillus crustosus]